jgi:hypothetical protein
METNLNRIETSQPKVELKIAKLPTLKTGDIQASAVKELAKSSDTAEAILLYFATRDRHTNKTDFQRHKMALRREGFKIVDADYEAAMKKMEEIGAGRVVWPRGRSQNPPRFDWSVNMKAFGRMAFDEEVIIVKLKEKEETRQQRAPRKEAAPTVKRKRGRPPGKKNTVQAKPNADTKHHTFYIHLAGNRIVEMLVPSDINASEIQVVKTVLEKQSKSA